MYNETEVEEERRLAYVGITRAKESFFILRRLKSRMLYGSTNYFHQSRFISEPPREFTEHRAGETGFRAMAGSSIGPQNTAVCCFWAREHHIDRGLQRFRRKASQKVTTEILIIKSWRLFSQGVRGRRYYKSNIYGGMICCLEIAFVKAGTKKTMARLAKLQKV